MYDDAIKCFDRALEINSKYAELALLGKVRVLHKQGSSEFKKYYNMLSKSVTCALRIPYRTVSLIPFPLSRLASVPLTITESLSSFSSTEGRFSDRQRIAALSLLKNRLIVERPKIQRCFMDHGS
jgi:hypothetical protein